MTIPFPPSRIGCAVAGLSFLLGAAPVLAAGFQLNETSGSGLGNAFAGGAAVAEDASTMWSNVAGMSRLRNSQVVGVLHLVQPSLKFRNDGSLAASGQALGGNGGDAGGLNFLPNLYAVKPIDTKWSVGIGMTAPWGLVTEYDDGWAGRFQAIKSGIKTINLNPGVSYKATDSLALGFGLNLQHMSAEFTNQVNYSGALLSAAALGGANPATLAGIAAATPNLETSARIKGSDSASGWNAGLLWDIDNQTRIGAQYRSSVKYHLEGNARFANPALSPLLGPQINGLGGAVNTLSLFDTAITSDVKIPAVVNLSYFGSVNDRWDLMADAQWTEWSSIQTLKFVRANGTVLQSTPENFKNSWKLAFGANYRYADNLVFKGGVAFDQSPVQTAFRTARLPDADRTWLTAGVQYKSSPKLALDFGAAYVFVKKASIDSDPTRNPLVIGASGLLNGHYKSHTAILTAQLNYAF